MTKGMASGDGLIAADTLPLQTDSGEIKMVNNFTYLGSVVSSDGEIFKVKISAVGWLKLHEFLAI